MQIIKVNNMLEGRELPDVKARRPVENLEDKLTEFKEILSAFDSIAARFRSTESSSEFLSACPIITTFLGKKDVVEEVFYAMKNGYIYQGVPAKLTYLVKKALQLYDTPNKAISMISQSSLLPYLRKETLPMGITVKAVIDNICGYETKLLLDSVRAVTNQSCIEVYVPNVDTVLVLPMEYTSVIQSREDLETVAMTPEGVTIRGHLFRTMFGKTGITKSDFDLRECI